jgi:hypothetical protein
VEAVQLVGATAFTLINIKDLEDLGSRFDGAPDLEFRAATVALELEQSALSYQRVPPGYRFPYGHIPRELHETWSRVNPPPEPGFARREARYDKNVRAETPAAGSSDGVTKPPPARRGLTGEPGVSPCY